MRYFVFFSLMLLFFSCQPRDAQHAEVEVPVDIAAEYADFAAFYKRFHQDSLYQMEHILFPLDGFPAEADSATLRDRSFRWQRDNWRMHRGFNLTESQFEQELQPLGKDLITETFYHEKSGFGLIRRFARIDGEWQLIYYAGLNRLRE